MLLESINSVNVGDNSNVVPLRQVVVLQPERGDEVKADLDDGYLRLANTLVDALCRTKLSDRESRVLFAIIRRTYGYGKAADWVCLDLIAEMTGISTSNICHAIKTLTQRRILIKADRKLGINPLVSDWIDKAKSDEKDLKPTKRPVAKIVDSDNKIVDSDNKSVVDSDNKIVDSDNAIVDSDNWDCRNREIQKKDNIHKDKRQKISSSQIENSILDAPLKNDAAIQTKNGKAWGTADDLVCAEYIFKKVLVVNPTAKTPNWPEWSNQVRLMREQDQRTHHEICQLFKFANRDAFWSSNVLSPQTLRKQWDKLAAKQHGQRSGNFSRSAEGIDWDAPTGPVPAHLSGAIAALNAKFESELLERYGSPEPYSAFDGEVIDGEVV